jgi:shikimate kinase
VSERAVDVTRPRVVLVGPPGAGKTTVGALLAQRWGVRAHDTDDAVAARAGKPVPDIFIDDGEPTFRELERAAVVGALTRCDGVVSVGGGAVLADETRGLLRGHTVVFLDVGLAAAVSRVGLDGARPLLFGNVRGRLKTLLDARRPLYQQVATVTVVTDDLQPDEVCDQIEERLAGG